MAVYSSQKLSYALIFFLQFLSGVEYAVILPTALQYLHRYDGNQLELGLCLSAYSFSSLFSSPIMGWMSDKSKNTKLIIIFANVWQICGSFMYFVGLSTWFIICGRLVGGVGLGVIGVTFSDIVKTTNGPKTSQILSRIMIGRQLGMIIGPAFNFLLLKLNYQLGPFLLDNLSAPGLFMAFCWFLLQVLMILFYKNLNEFDQESIPQPALIVNTINTIENDSDPVADETSPLLNSSINQTENQQSTSYQQTSPRSPRSPKYNRVRIVDNSEAGSLLSRLYYNYVKEEIITVYTATFTVFFMQTSLETLLTPFTRDYFRWNDIENSIFYAIAGLDIMLVFLILSFISKRVKDRNLLLIGILGNLASLIFLIFYLPNVKQKNENTFKDYALFIFPVFANVSSLPIIVLSSISLLSKLTSKESQGLTQGLRRTAAGIACILGPLWSGAFYGSWYILVGSLIGLLCIALIMTLLSFKYLKQNENEQITINNNNNDD